MKKVIYFSFLVSVIVICVSCSDSTTSSNSGYGLPNEFPLEEGNAWIYERAYYENGLKDSTILDTLYIAGKFEDYFYYSWDPVNYVNLVKNIDNKLVNFGSISSYGTGIDTTFYDYPSIWAFFGETGYIDSTHFENYYYAEEDSLYITILENEEYFDRKYDTYVTERKRIEYFFSHRFQYLNKLGFAKWEYFDECNNPTESTKMIRILEDFYPEEMLTNTNREKRKSFNQKPTYSQDGVLRKE